MWVYIAVIVPHKDAAKGKEADTQHPNPDPNPKSNPDPDPKPKPSPSLTRRTSSRRR